VFIPVHNDIYEMSVCAELCEWFESIKCIRRHAREGFNGPLQLQVIGVKYDIGLPFLWHVIQILEGSEPRGQWFRQLDFREGRSLWHLPSDEGNKDQQLVEVKLVALVLCFSTSLLQLVDEVAHLVNLHAFNAFSCEVDDEPHDLRWSILPDDITNDQLTS
jgi:hypothetical protein